MHQAPTYIIRTLFPDTSIANVKVYAISQAEAIQIRNHLYNDFLSYIYSATVTIGDAIQGIRHNLFTWATVKLYYATFYACRALLALDDICIFYLGSKPFRIEAIVGKTPQSKKGQTHQVVLDEFKSQGVVPLLNSQNIGSDDPLKWLLSKREEANYRVAKFQEPNVPEHFQKIVDLGIRQTLTAYLQDSSHTYLFDAEHAMVAYPLITLRYAYDKMKAFSNLRLTDTEISYLCSLFKDKHGPIPEAHNMIRSE